MADHHAEQIMDAFTPLVTGLTTTRSNVKRDESYPIEGDTSSALSLSMGPDEPLEDADQSWPYLDSYLTIYVDIFARVGSTTPVSQTLNLIRKEITVAVKAVDKLGLSPFVHDVREGVADEPEIDHGEKPIARQRTAWRVKYRRLESDPSTI